MAIRSKKKKYFLANLLVHQLVTNRKDQSVPGGTMIEILGSTWIFLDIPNMVLPGIEWSFQALTRVPYWRQAEKQKKGVWKYFFFPGCRLYKSRHQASLIKKQCCLTDNAKELQAIQPFMYISCDAAGSKGHGQVLWQSTISGMQKFWCTSQPISEEWQASHHYGPSTGMSERIVILTDTGNCPNCQIWGHL